MSRNGSGTYSLPEAPFVYNTVISETAMNSNLSDIASALTGSLAKDGQTTATGNFNFGGFDISNALFEAVDGTASAPGIAFKDDLDTGLFSTDANAIQIAAGGSNAGTLSANTFRNHIAGLILSNNGTDGDHDIDISVGFARDATNAVGMDLGSSLTKQLDASWAVGTGAGGLDGTESVAGTPDASTVYYVWLIKRSDTGVVDALFSESASSPTMPTNYDYKRLIGFVVTNASSNIIAFVQSGNYFRFTGAVVEDVNDSTVTSGNFEDGTLSVPPNCVAHLYGSLVNTASTASTDGHLSIVTKGASEGSNEDEAFMRLQTASNFDRLTKEGLVLVNGSSQIQYMAVEGTGSATVIINTMGCFMLTRENP